MGIKLMQIQNEFGAIEAFIARIEADKKFLVAIFFKRKTRTDNHQNK